MEARVVGGWIFIIVLAALLILAVAGLLYARWANRRSGTRVE